MYDTVVFDLDGTLTDSGEGIINSVLYALQKYHIEVEDSTVLRNFLGPPLQESFQKYFHFSEEESQAVVEVYREYFVPKGMFENRVYDGVLDLLQRIKASGRKVVVATAKPQQFSNTILQHFHLDPYIDFVGGATLDGVRRDKAEIIRYALAHLGVSDLSTVVMVGDRKFDIEGAKAVGVDAIGVLYGYGSEEELRAAGADYLVRRPEDIMDLL